MVPAKSKIQYENSHKDFDLIRIRFMAKMFFIDTQKHYSKNITTFFYSYFK